MTRRVLIRGARVLDATIDASPGAVLLNGWQVIAAGSPESIGTPGDAEVIDRPRDVLIPGLINAHAHLDLSHIGPQPAGDSFDAWIGMIRAQRATSTAAIADSVELGIDRSRRGGTAAIGDIAGVRSTVPLEVMRRMRMTGTSFIEVFGIGESEDDAKAFLKKVDASYPHPIRRPNADIGLQPHAPYSCSLATYSAALQTGRPLSTHLAETLDEIEFTESGTGRFRTLLEKLGVWNDSITPTGLHPIEHLGSMLSSSHCVAAHLNYIEERHLGVLAAWPITVAYCPRASAYFGHRDHPYRAMLAAGVDVALGTDSQVCLETPDRISVLDDMRLLALRDGVAAQELLTLATENGARALQLDPSLVSFRAGPTLGILAVDSGGKKDGFLSGDSAPEWVAGPFCTDGSEIDWG